MGITKQSADRRLTVAQDQLARRGAEDPHLVLDVGCHDAVGAQQVAGLGVK